MPDQVLLAGLSWDPFVRGLVIFLASVVILPGSVYLLLATNTGGRLGFLLALTGLSGWMMAMGVVWTVFGIGPKGREPAWKVQDVVTGEVSDSTVEAVQGFPRGWERLQKGDAELADAEAAAQPVLVPGGGAEGGEGGGGGHGGGGEGGGEQQQTFSSPFKTPEDFEVVGARRKGGETYLLTFRHRPHYVVYQVKPAAEEATTPAGATPQVGASPGGGSGTSTQPAPGQPPAAVTPAPLSQTPSGATPPPGAEPPGGITTQPSASAPPPPAQPAPTAPERPRLTSVIMVRDLGNVRLPPFLVTLAFFLVFSVCCYVLHQRDKEILQARGAQVT